MGIIISIYFSLIIYIIISFSNNELLYWIKKSRPFNVSESLSESDKIKEIQKHSKKIFYGQLSNCQKANECLQNSDYKEFIRKKAKREMIVNDIF